MWKLFTTAAELLWREASFLTSSLFVGGANETININIFIYVFSNMESVNEK